MTFIVSKIKHYLSVLLLLALITFFIGTLSGIDYTDSLRGLFTSRSEALELRTNFGLNVPLEMQFISWMNKIIHGQWINSVKAMSDPTPYVLKALTKTLTLMGLATAMAYINAIVLSFFAYRYRERWFEKLLRLFTYCGLSVPEVWLSLIIVGVLRRSMWGLGFLGQAKPFAQLTFLDHAQILMIPLVIMTFKLTAILMRYIRGPLIEISNQEFITSARSYGVTEFQLYQRHMLRNISIPLLTLGSQIVPEILGAAAILEIVFGRLGIGSMALNAAFGRDIPLLISITLITGTITVLISFAMDTCYWLADPRIRD